MNKLPKKFKDKWVKALLSGDFEQNTTGTMEFDGKVCVLGLGAFVKFGDPERGWNVFDEYGEDQWPIECELFGLNDSGVPFEVLAGVINEWL